MTEADIRSAGLLGGSPEALGRLATRLRRDPGRMEAGSMPIKVAVLASFMTDYLVDMLRLMLAHRGFAASIVACGYGQMMHELLAGGPALASEPDLVVLLPDHRDLRHAPPMSATAAEADAAALAEAGFWLRLAGKIAQPVVMLSFGLPPHRLLNEGDGFLPGGLGRHARRATALLADRLPRSVCLVDTEALHSRLGAWACDAHLYALCKQPFAMEALPEIADTLAAAAASALGRARKVLVLDLDNTIWGGVVGDVGVGGLALGSETAEGEAFVGLQMYARALAQRGVILAVCSKNDEAVARGAFRDHSAMVLTLRDIACFVANFEDKATNLRLIARTLNVGLDALVFVDDNPVERAWVRRELPEVWTIELPDDPAGYVAAIDAVKPFPAYRLTQEDLGRGSSYQAMAQMRDGAAAATDMEGFLRDLQPVARVEAMDQASVGRAVQLIGKTNQFKLNASSFTAEEFCTGVVQVIALRLSDRLQDYGIVAVAVTEFRDGRLQVLNWVMSCRVFGRRVEHAMRELLVARARTGGARAVVARFVPSGRNTLVQKALLEIGFSEIQPGVFETFPDCPAMAPHYMDVADLGSSMAYELGGTA